MGGSRFEVCQLATRSNNKREEETQKVGDPLRRNCYMGESEAYNRRMPLAQGLREDWENRRFLGRTDSCVENSFAYLCALLVTPQFPAEDIAKMAALGNLLI